MREPTQAEITRRYERLAPVYDLYDLPMELLVYHRRRRRLLQQATGRALEVGIGTGRNLPHYPPGVALTGIDVAPRMLARTERRARKLGVPVRLSPADVRHLPFPDDAFDTAAATFVFCSVADPVEGLRELGRVVKPDGLILLLEHVRPRNPLLGRLADLLTPLVRHLFGFALNRQTEENIERAGLTFEPIGRSGIWREIQARPSHEGRLR